MAWVTLLVGLAKDLFQASYNVAAEQKARIVRIATGVSLLVVLAVIGVGVSHALGRPAPEHPAWETALLARMVLARAFAGVGLFFLAVLTAVLTFQALEHTDMFKRLTVWKTESFEAVSVQAAKTKNAGIILAVLLVAAALIFASALK